MKENGLIQFNNFWSRTDVQNTIHGRKIKMKRKKERKKVKKNRNRNHVSECKLVAEEAKLIKSTHVDSKQSKFRQAGMERSEGRSQEETRSSREDGSRWEWTVSVI